MSGVQQIGIEQRKYDKDRRKRMAIRSIHIPASHSGNYADIEAPIKIAKRSIGKKKRKKKKAIKSRSQSLSQTFGERGY